MTALRSRLSGAAAVAAGAGALAGVLLLRPDHRLTGEDLAAIRREALDLFPPGSRVAEARRRLMGMGFRCATVEHKLPNLSSPSLACDSNGRSFPATAGFNLTVMGRDGMVADIDVWNTFGTADGGVLQATR